MLAGVRSGRLRESAPGAMAAVVAHHHELLDEAISLRLGGQPLRAVAHGGQIIMSRTTRDLVFDRLPEHAELTDLGIHRLRDLGRPEHVFGLKHPDLPAEFPPLRSLDTIPNNLPGELTTFVGRRTELAQIDDPLQHVRLLTLPGVCGPGVTPARMLRSAAHLLSTNGLNGMSS